MKLLDRYETVQVAWVSFKEPSLLFEGGGIFVRRLGVMALQGEGLAWRPRRLVHGQALGGHQTPESAILHESWIADHHC